MDWSPDGKELYFVGFERGIGNIWALRVDEREVRPITRFDSDTIRGLAVSRYPPAGITGSWRS